MARIDTFQKSSAIDRILANGGVYSQAQNFLGVVSSQVDPRTGQFMLAINLPALIANSLSGPTLTPSLSYDAQASLQNNGFGLGWSLLLSHIDLSASSASLRLSSGEQFAIDLQHSVPGVGGMLAFFDHKLKDLLVTRISDDAFRIDRKTGEIEILTRQQSTSVSYYLSEMRTPEGRRLFLNWRLAAADTYRIDRITDETGRTLLSVMPRTGSVDFVINPDDAPLVLTLSLTNDRVSRVTLSDSAGNFNYQFGFQFRQQAVGNGISFWFPESLSGPLGASDTVIWTPDAASSHRLPVGAPITHLPRVSSWRQSSGSPDNVLTHDYQWVGQTNFLGYGSALGFDWEDGRDNLYQVEHAYRYSSIETLRHSDLVLSTIERTWNNFHLLVRTVTSAGSVEVTTDTTYWIDDQVGWERQPAYCQLPHLTTTTYTDKKTNTQRSESTTYTYDDSGNLLTVIYPTGITENYEYYPADGSRSGCPYDALGQKLDMIRFLQKKTSTPAIGDYDAPALSTTYEYQNLDSMAEEDSEQPHAVVVRELARNETDESLMEMTEQTYERDKSSAHYGREILATTTLNGMTTTTRLLHELIDEKLTTQIVVEGHDLQTRPASRSVTSSSRCVLTGLTASEVSSAGVVTAYEYDHLGRLTRTIIAQNSPFQAERSQSYHVGDEGFISEHRPVGVAATIAVEETDASGQRRRTWLDGAGRQVCVELQDLDNTPVIFREVSRTVYDALGRAVRHTNKEWSDGMQVLELSTTTTYDDWGNASAVTSPSGVITHTQYDPVILRIAQWQEGSSGRLSPREVTYNNVAGSAIRHEFFDESGALIRTTVLARDGLDRVVELATSAAGEADTLTFYKYDAYSRVTEQTRPDGVRIMWTYAGHSDSDHVTSIEVTEG